MEPTLTVLMRIGFGPKYALKLKLKLITHLCPLFYKVQIQAGFILVTEKQTILCFPRKQLNMKT